MARCLPILSIMFLLLERGSFVIPKSFIIASRDTLYLTCVCESVGLIHQL